MALKYFETATAYTAANPKDSDICFVEDEGAVYTHGEKFGGGGNETYVETTWSQLRTLRNNSELIPGTIYRITDYNLYISRTYQSFRKSGNHPFDILVKALTTNVLSEDASAIQHAGDTYFANSNLSAWKLKYCLQESTNARFDWYEPTYTRGVIYYMEDEFGNSAPFDFKNMTIAVDTSEFNANSTWCTAVLGSIPTETQYYYLFSTIQDGVIQDGSVINAGKVWNNKIGVYSSSSDSKLELSKNIIITTSSTKCYGNTFIKARNIWLGPGSNNNTFIEDATCVIQYASSCNFTNSGSIKMNNVQNSIFNNCNQFDFTSMSSGRVMYCYFGPRCYDISASGSRDIYNCIFEGDNRYITINPTGTGSFKSVTFESGAGRIALTANTENSYLFTIRKGLSRSDSTSTYTLNVTNASNGFVFEGQKSTYNNVNTQVYKFWLSNTCPINTFTYNLTNARTVEFYMSSGTPIDCTLSEYHIFINGCTVDGAKLKIPSTILDCPVYVDGFSTADYTFTLDLNKNNWESGKEYTEINLIKQRVASTSYRWLVKTDGDWDKTAV